MPPLTSRHLLSPVIVPCLAFSLFMLALTLLPEALRQQLVFNSERVVSGQWWRLWTGHWLHLNGWHWAMNSGALLLIVWIFRDVLRPVALLCWWCATPLLISLGFLLFDQPIEYYAGLSGAIYGLLVLGLLLGWRGNLWLHLLVLLAVAGRLGWEQHPNYDPLYLQQWIDGAVHVNAHLFGALSGILLALLMVLVARVRAGSITRRR